MKNVYFILLGIGIVICSNILGHYFAPFSLMTTFIYVNLIIGIINLNLYKNYFKITILYNFIMLLVNDFLIRKFAGGTHDSQGMAWCWLMFHLGFAIAVIIMITYSLTIFKADRSEKFSNFNVVIIGAILSAVFYNFVNAKI